LPCCEGIRHVLKVALVFFKQPLSMNIRSKGAVDGFHEDARLGGDQLCEQAQHSIIAKGKLIQPRGPCGMLENQFVEKARFRKPREQGLEVFLIRRIIGTTVEIAESDEQIADCFAVMRELRPHVAEAGPRRPADSGSESAKR